MKTIKTLITLLVVALIVTSCGTASLMSDSSGGKDGSTFEKAVIASSVRAEYKWVDRTYPGSQLLSQVVMVQNGKTYDIVSIKTKEGSEKDVYFDISGFYKPKDYNVTEQ